MIIMNDDFPKIVDIADELHRELGEDCAYSIPVIAFWLRANIGKLNNLIGTEMSIDENTLEFAPALGENEKVILKKLYLIHYYDLQIRSNLSSSSASQIRKVESDDSAVTYFDSTRHNQHYLQIKKDESRELKTLVDAYRLYGCSPLQVAGDDTIAESEDPKSNTRTDIYNG